MTALETHIEIRQSIERLGINDMEGYQPEQIELAYNTVLDTYITKRVDKDPTTGGYRIDPKYIQDLEPLVTYKNLPVFKDTKAGSVDKSYAVMPPDYRYLLSDTSFVTRDCDKDWLTLKDGSPYSETVMRLDFHPSTASVPPYYQQVAMSFGTTVVADLSSTGVPEKNAFFFFLYPLIRDVNKEDNLYEFYWERYRQFEEANTIFIIGPKTSVTLNIDGTITDTVVPDTKTRIYQYTKYTGTGMEKPNRLTSSLIIKQSQQNSFHRTDWDSPISELSERYLYVHRHSGFIVNSVNVGYVRNQRRLSLLLNHTTELSNHVQRELVQLTAEHIKAETENMQGYQLKLMDNKKNHTE